MSESPLTYRSELIDEDLASRAIALNFDRCSFIRSRKPNTQPYKKLLVTIIA